jgi:hypothetical protein
MTAKVNFSEADWERIERDYTAWWAGELERPLLVMSGRKPGMEVPEFNRFLPNHPEKSPEAVCDMLDQACRATQHFGDGFPWVFINFGPGVLAAFVGAKVHRRPETIWFEPSEPREIKDITLVFDPDSEVWQRVVAITQAAVDYWDGRMAVSHTDLGGNLDVVASLRSTERLLTDLIDEPEEVERLVWAVKDAWCESYDRLATIIRTKCRGTVSWAQNWSSRQSYMLQCDFCYMISPAMFRRFVQPELAAVCNTLDDAFYHLDGPGALPHLDALLEIESLKGIQWIPGAGQREAAEWPDVLRRIREGGKLCQIHCSPEQALNVTRELGGRGFQFIIGGGFDADSAAAFIRDIERAVTPK